MKALKFDTFRVSVVVALVAILVTAAACQDKKGGAQDTKTVKTGVKPPQLDIHTAVVSGNLEAVRQHIAAGSDINAKDPFGGSSPLISAAVFGQTAIARELIDAGADLNIQNNDGSTALICAAFFCRPEIVKMLLDKGADKTINNKYNTTAFQNVAGPFKDMKPAYDMMVQVLGPMGLKLDYAYLEKTRPVIASMLK